MDDMTYRDLSVTGNAFVANHQHIYLGDEFVKVSPVPIGDLAATAEGRFADPGGQWTTAGPKLLDYGVVILRGPQGSGRHGGTAAARPGLRVRPALLPQPPVGAAQPHPAPAARPARSRLHP